MKRFGSVVSEKAPTSTPVELLGLDSHLEESWSNPQLLQRVSHMFTGAMARIERNGDIPDGLSGGFSREEEYYRDKLFVSLGFTPDESAELMGAWSTYDPDLHPQVTRAKYFTQQLNVAVALFAQNPEAPKDLLHEFGIRHFGRYEPEDLLSQLGLEREHGLPLDIMIAAVSDTNYSMAHIGRVGEEASPLERPIYYEASSITQLLRSLVKARNRYGRPVDTLLIAAHGFNHGIILNEPLAEGAGSEKMDQAVLSSDIIINSRAARRLKESGVFADDAQILLEVCETGEIGGIGDILARKTGATVFAAAEPMTRFERTDSGELVYFTGKDNRSQKPVRHKQ